MDMTEEQIKQNAERFASVYYHPYDSENNPQYLTVSEDSFIAGAHSRDEEIDELKKQLTSITRLKIHLLMVLIFLITTIRNCKKNSTNSAINGLT